MEKIVVIGSNSFSGATFTAQALEAGAEVAGVSRSKEPARVFLPYRWLRDENQKRFQFHSADINNDLNKITDLIQSFKPDYVVNFAAQSMVAESWQNPEHWMMTNVVSTVRLHDFLRKCAFLKKYVHISTPEVYGSCSGLVQESTHYNPSTPYAVSKAAVDMSLMTFFKNYDFPVCFTRAANVYGPGQQLYRIIPRTVLFCLTEQKLQLHGGGHSVRSFIHMKDVAEGTLRVMRSAQAGGIYHFSTTRNISIRQIVEMITVKLNIKFEDAVKITEDRPGKDAAYLLDSSKAKKELGWEDRISLEHGIDETIAWVKTNLAEIKKQPLSYSHKA